MCVHLDTVFNQCVHLHTVFNQSVYNNIYYSGSGLSVSLVFTGWSVGMSYSSVPPPPPLTCPPSLISRMWHLWMLSTTKEEFILVCTNLFLCSHHCSSVCNCFKDRLFDRHLHLSSVNLSPSVSLSLSHTHTYSNFFKRWLQVYDCFVQHKCRKLKERETF